MGRKRAFTDSTDREAYINADEHENHPAELTRSNQFLSLKDACDGPGDGEASTPAAIHAMDSKSKSQGYISLNARSLGEMGASELEIHTPESKASRKQFSLAGSGDIFGSPESRKATWLDTVPGNGAPFGDSDSGLKGSSEVLRDPRRDVLSSDSKTSLGSRTSSTNPTIKRINSNPSFQEIEQFMKQQEDGHGNVDWRQNMPPSPEPAIHKRILEPMTVPGTAMPHVAPKDALVVEPATDKASATTVRDVEKAAPVRGSRDSPAVGSDIDHSGVSPSKNRVAPTVAPVFDHGACKARTPAIETVLVDHGACQDHAPVKSGLSPASAAGIDHSGIISSAPATPHAASAKRSAKREGKKDCVIM